LFDHRVSGIVCDSFFADSKIKAFFKGENRMQFKVFASLWVIFALSSSLSVWAMSSQERSEFVTGLRAGCQQQMAGLSSMISSDKAQKYCDCTANQAANSFQNVPFSEAFTPDKKPTAKALAVMQQVAQTCSAQIMR
jgi:hypothetical protein